MREIYGFLARRLANPFGRPSQVRTQVCVDLQVRLARALDINSLITELELKLQISTIFLLFFIPRESSGRDADVKRFVTNLDTLDNTA